MTAQQPDRLHIGLVQFLLLADLPLGPMAARLPRGLRAPHTALWRGYTADWSIADDVLVLQRIDCHTESGRETVEVGPDEGRATWVTARFRVGAGEQVRHVHGGYGSRYAQELLVDVVAGRVRAVEPLAPAAPYGSAGPYALHEHVDGGAFGLVYAGEAADGEPVVAKIAMAGTHDPWRVTFLVRDDGRCVPLGSGPTVAATGPAPGPTLVRNTEEIAAAVLEAQHDVLERDGGVLFPASRGLWVHDPSGLPALVMERIEGRGVESEADVVAVLDALAAAAERGGVPAHGDLKRSHVRISATGQVRLLDPAPPLPDGLRMVTPFHNPHGWTGPAADVAACGWMMRYRLPQPQHAWTWVRRVCDFPQPPEWALRHADARDELRRCLGSAAPPFPPSWSVPEFPLTSAFGAPPSSAPSAGYDDGSADRAPAREAARQIDYLRALLADVGRLAAPP